MVTYGSTSIHMVARATRAAALDAKRQILELAANHLEANPEDLDIRERRIFVKGSPDKGITLKELMKTPIYEYLSSPEIGRRRSRSPSPFTVLPEIPGMLASASCGGCQVSLRRIKVAHLPDIYKKARTC